MSVDLSFSFIALAAVLVVSRIASRLSGPSVTSGPPEAVRGVVVGGVPLLLRNRCDLRWVASYAFALSEESQVSQC
jgi:hypothetical protein